MVNRLAVPALIAAVVCAALTGCSTPEPAPAPAAPSPPPAPSSTAPVPVKVFLDAAHAGRWPLTDTRLLAIAHSHCLALADPTSKAGGGEGQANLLVATQSFTRDQAEGFVYEAQRAFCPDKVGR